MALGAKARTIADESPLLYDKIDDNYVVNTLHVLSNDVITAE